MKGFYCDYCKVLLKKGTPKFIVAHNKSNKHIVNKAAYFFELEEDLNISENIKNVHKTLSVDIKSTKRFNYEI